MLLPKDHIVREEAQRPQTMCLLIKIEIILSVVETVYSFLTRETAFISFNLTESESCWEQSQHALIVCI